jgi:hypothetical protein
MYDISTDTIIEGNGGITFGVVIRKYTIIEGTGI